MSDEDLAERVERDLMALGAEHGFSRLADALSKTCNSIANQATLADGQSSPTTVVWKSAGNLFQTVKGVEDAR